MQRIVPYLQLMRLHKPIGIWLLFFPAAWGVLLTPAPVPWDLLFIMLVGAVLIRSAGCIINDLTDQELDRQVERTKHRPLAAGTVTRTEAKVLLLVLLLDGLILCLVLPPLVVKLACLALPFIAAYPWMKRITWWPQAFLGLTFNFGALMGWAATGQAINTAPLLLYAACFFWTLGYDTLYAVEDMQGDSGAGIKSTARRIGLGPKLGAFTALCYGLMLLLFMRALGPLGQFILVAFGGAALHALWQVWQSLSLTEGDPRGGVLFRSNQWLGLTLLLGLLIERHFAYLS